MGDAAMTVPVIAAVRRANPELRITVLTRPAFRPFFDGLGVDFADVDLKGRHKGIVGLCRLARELRRSGIDSVADLHGVMRSNVITACLGLSGCRTAHIRKGRAEKKLLTRCGYLHSHQLKTSVQRYLDVFVRLGVKADALAPFVKTGREVPPQIAAKYPKNGLWVGISPFAMHRGKAYPLESMRRVAELLSKDCDRVFVFGGGAAEKAAAEELQSVAENVVSVVGVMSLRDEMNLMANLDVMLTMDSSAMHIASIVATPVVSVWGATHPYAGFYGYGQSEQNAVQLPLACRPCSVYGKKKCRFGDYRCMTRITPETVALKVMSLLHGADCEKNNGE